MCTDKPALMLLLLFVMIGLSSYCRGVPICPLRSATAGQPRFTKPLGEFDYVQYGMSVAIQCCSEGVGDISWYRQEVGLWKPFPPENPGISNIPKLEEEKQILRIYEADFNDNTTFKCELEPKQSGAIKQGGSLQQHQLQLFVVACDKIARGPLMTKPFPEDQYIDEFGGNVTVSCSGYFGCSDSGNPEGDSYWQVKEHGRYRYASQVSPRYRVVKDWNPEKTIRVANLTISPVLPEDLDRVFICKLSSPQLYQGQTSRTVEIFKRKGPADITLWVGIGIAGVVVLGVVVFVASKMWGPQIKWYLRSRVPFIGPKPVSDENLTYNAFIYHADEDTRIANELKEKLKAQNFEIYLSSDVPPNKPKMATIQMVSSSSAVVIFLYTENLWNDDFTHFLLQSVVEYRQGKGILFLEIEKFPEEKAMGLTERAKEDRERRGLGPISASISIEEDGAANKNRKNTEDEIRPASENGDNKIDIKFWRALPRVKVPTEKSTARKKRNFQCAIQNRLPLLKNQVLAQKRSTSSSLKRSSNNSRNSSSGKPLMSEESPLGQLSPTSDDVFVSEGEQKFAFDNEAVNRNASIQNSRQNTAQGFSQKVPATHWQPLPPHSQNEAVMAANMFLPHSQNEALIPHSQNEATVPYPVIVNVDVHTQRDIAGILPNQNGIIPHVESEIVNEVENNRSLKPELVENADIIKIESLTLERTGSPSENGVFTLSGEEYDQQGSNVEMPGHALTDDYLERCESGYTEESLSESQSCSPGAKTNSIPVSNSNLKSEANDHKFQNGPQCPNDERQLNFSPGARSNSFGSGHESGYITSPTAGSTGSSPEGSSIDPFMKHNKGVGPRQPPYNSVTRVNNGNHVR